MAKPQIGLARSHALEGRADGMRPFNHKPGSSTSRSSKATEKATCTSAAPAWRRARKRLDELAYRITPEDRSKIEDALALRVPLPTPEFF